MLATQSAVQAVLFSYDSTGRGYFHRAPIRLAGTFARLPPSPRVMPKFAQRCAPKAQAYATP